MNLSDPHNDEKNYHTEVSKNLKRIQFQNADLTHFFFIKIAMESLLTDYKTLCDEREEVSSPQNWVKISYSLIVV